MSVKRQTNPSAEIDLDATAELPIPDFSDAVSAPALDATATVQTLGVADVASTTDTHQVIAFADGASELIKALQDAEERLARKVEHLNNLELSLESARAAEHQLRESMDRDIASARQAARLEAAVAREEAARAVQQAQAELLKAAQDAAAQAGQARTLEARVAEVSARADDLAGQLAQTRARLEAGRAAEHELLESMEHDIASAREAARREAAAAREEAARAVQQAQAELLKATQDAAAQAGQARTLEARVAEVSARADDLAGQLAETRVRLESAQREAAAAREEAGRAVQQVQAELLKATQDAAAQASRTRALEARVAEVSARADDLAGQLAQTHARLEAERAASAVAQQSLAKQGAEYGRRLLELAEIRAVNERQLEALRSVEGYRAVSQGLLDEREARISELERSIVLFEEQRQDAERKLTAVEQQLTQGGEAIAGQHAQLSALTAEREAGAARIAELELALRDGQAQAAAALAEREGLLTETITDQQQAIAWLQTERSAHEAQMAVREQDLRAAEDELAQRASRVEELLRGNEMLAQMLAQARAEVAARDTRLQKLETQTQSSAAILAALQQTIQKLGREEAAAPAPAEGSLDNMQRALVLGQPGAETVYTLSRRTTVGRTADNDIALDTDFISRHHAVLLASSRHTILEDLNSTNGVRVNGRRVTRQVLHDGDVVTIGKTEFRYLLRPLAGTP